MSAEHLATAAVGEPDGVIENSIWEPAASWMVCVVSAHTVAAVASVQVSAESVGVAPAYLSQIANGVRPCPSNRAPAIEAACESNLLDMHP